MARTSVLVLLGLLVLPISALADEPAEIAAPPVSAGHFFIGGGVAWSIPLNSSVSDLHQSAAVSIDLSYEWEHALLGLQLTHAPGFDLSTENSSPTGGAWGPVWDQFGMRSAWIPFSWHRISPYFGGGLGYLFEARRGGRDDEGSFVARFDKGFAANLEAGAELFRESRWGRVTVSLQAVLPFFSVTTVYEQGSRYVPIFNLGLHAQL